MYNCITHIRRKTSPQNTTYGKTMKNTHDNATGHAITSQDKTKQNIVTYIYINIEFT